MLLPLGPILFERLLLVVQQLRHTPLLRVKLRQKRSSIRQGLARG
jgi:hypothetical protein